MGGGTLAAALLLVVAHHSVIRAEAANVLVVYADDPRDLHSTEQLAVSVQKGATDAGATAVRCIKVEDASFATDVLWADAIVVGSGDFNGNANPAALAFINTWDFTHDFSNKVGSAFATAGAAAAGLQPVLGELARALQTFRLVIAGGATWQSGQGTGAIVNSTGAVVADDLQTAYYQGQRVTQVAQALASLAPFGPTPAPAPTPPTPPTPSPPVGGGPPGFGLTWKAKVSANLTQPGYDAGLVIVNFTTLCGEDPHEQMMRTVYGDSYTVLTRCDLGWEYTIAPASRGSGCLPRLIGRDVDARICGACGCPFCVRDTNGTYSHGERSNSVTEWGAKTRMIIGGHEVDVWKGTASSTGSGGAEPFALGTNVAFFPDGITPAFVNVSHPLWVQTAASFEDFTTDVDNAEFGIPDNCPLPPHTTKWTKH